MESEKPGKVFMSEFETPKSAFQFAEGFLDGAIGVLPKTSFPAYCRGNITNMEDSVDDLVDYYEAEDREDTLTSLQKTLKAFAGITFNCFYSVVDPTNFNNQGKGFGRTTIMFNVLYNLGYMYTDLLKISKLLDSDQSSSDDWENMGKYTGDFFLRFFWSRYVPRNYHRR